MAAITIRYKGEVIAEISAAEPTTKILNTSGKFTEGDIELNYINYCPRAESISSFSMNDFFNFFTPTASAIEITE